MGKKNRIVQPGDGQTVQLGLFSVENTGEYERLADYPKVYRDEEGFKKVVAGVTDMCGLDFEFNTKTLKPTVIGVSNYEECAAVWFTPEIMSWLERERKSRGFVYSGHAVLTADRQVLEAAVKKETRLSDWSDSMLTFWMANADLCKAPGKETDEEGGLGFMGLGTMGSLTTDLPHHKTCRGRNCEGLICPRCLRGDSLVWMADGTKRRIADLTTSRSTEKVLAFDRLSGQVVPAPITNWFKTPRGSRRFLRVKGAVSALSGGPDSANKGVVVTDDHKFLTTIGWVEARRLTKDHLVATGTTKPSEWSRRFLAGLFLGDTNLRRSVVTMTHGQEQVEWLELKSQLFRFSEPKRRADGAYTSTGGGTAFYADEIRKYRNSWETWVRGNFSFESLVLWFLDDGSYHKYTGVISVSSYEEWEIQVLVDVISSTLVCAGGVKYFIRDEKGGKRRRTIELNSAAMAEFCRRAAQYVPPSMRYKIAHPRVLQELDDFQPRLWYGGPEEQYWAPVSVALSTGRKNHRTGKEEDNFVHCIEVAGYHNFITEGGVVSNCDVRGYCAVDAYVGLLGDRRSRQDLAEYNVPLEAILFTHELQEIAKKMQDLGIYVDREYVATLGAQMAEQQEKLFPAKGEPGYIFNPRSPKEVSEWFRERKIYLTSTDKDAAQTALEKLAAEHGFTAERFEDLRERLAAEENLDPTLDALFRLYTYKVLGKGTDSWFHDRYFDKAGLVHPRFVTTGTSTGRFSSASPNFQNCPKRGWGKLVRKAIVPRSPGNIIVEADYSQLELRICLYLAGVDQSVIGEDAFTWLVSKSGGLFDKAAQRYGGIPRDIAKSVSHGSNYLEGLRLIAPAELTYARTKNEIVAGALRVYHPDYTDRVSEPWMFGGKVVAFTGSNLAQRLFGSKTLESRKKALEIQEDIYFAAFPQIRKWQQEVTVAGDKRGYALAPTGRFLRLNDTPEKNMKLIVAFLGQGVGASHMQSTIIQFYRQFKHVFMCTIHDALVGEFPLSGGYRAIYDRMQFMSLETPLLPGFTCPIKIEVGKNWGAMEELFQRNGQLYVGEEKEKDTWREVE